MKKILLLSLALMLFTICAAFGATANPSPASPGYTPVVLPVMGTYTSTRLNLVRFTAPSGYNVVSVSAIARDAAGTTPTAKLRLKSGSFTNYSGTLAAAGTTKVLTAGSTTRIVDESSVVLDIVTGGTSPVWKDLTVFILLKRL